MRLVLDASVVLSWFVERPDAQEVALAAEVLTNVERGEAVVPLLWFAEIANGLLVAEARNLANSNKTAKFLGELAAMPIAEDSVRPRHVQREVLSLGRRYGLTAYDATYLELTLRIGVPLATFDQKLAEAARTAGVRVFGDAP